MVVLNDGSTDCTGEIWRGLMTPTASTGQAPPLMDGSVRLGVPEGSEGSADSDVRRNGCSSLMFTSPCIRTPSARPSVTRHGTSWAW